MPAPKRLARAESTLRLAALDYPETSEDFPWGHRALKVRGKTFLFLFLGDDFLSLSVKLPESGSRALALPFASPTEYGLGKSGWVTARFEGQADVPLAMLREWLEESYRAVAPRKLVACLEHPGKGAPPTARPRRETPARR